jgi:hypothetical protein
VTSATKRLTRRWKASAPSRSASAVEPLDVDEQENALLEPRPVIAAGDEIQEHVLPEQVVDVVDEANDENDGEGEQDVAALDRQRHSKLSRGRKQPGADDEAEEDDDEVDAGLDDEVDEERQLAQPRHRRLCQPALKEKEQAGNQDAGQYAARHAADTEERQAVRHRHHVGVGAADDRADRGEPQKVFSRRRDAL